MVDTLITIALTLLAVWTGHLLLDHVRAGRRHYEAVRRELRKLRR